MFRRIAGIIPLEPIPDAHADGTACPVRLTDSPTPNTGHDPPTEAVHMAVSPPLAIACYLKAHILCTVRECECNCHKRETA